MTQCLIRTCWSAHKHFLLLLITTSEISGPESFIMGETVYQEYEEGETFVRAKKQLL